MSIYHPENKTIVLKILVSGPQLSGKTEFLRSIQRQLDPGSDLSNIPEVKSFLEFLPITAQPFKDFDIQIHLMGFSIQENFNSLNQIILKGADAVFHILDARPQAIDKNVHYLDDVRALLAHHQHKMTVKEHFVLNFTDHGQCLTPLDFSSFTTMRSEDTTNTVASMDLGTLNALESAIQNVFREVLAATHVPNRNTFSFEPQL